MNIKKIDAWEKRYRKFITPSVLIAIVTTIRLMYYAEQLPQGKVITDYPNLSIPSAIIAEIGYPFSLILYLTGKGSKISGYELNALRLYRALMKISEYKKDNLTSTRKKASTNIKKLLFDSPSSFSRESKRKPTFHFLESHKEIYHKILKQFLPAIQKAKPEQVEQIQTTLVLLIDWFFAMHVDNIQLINQNLDKYPIQEDKSDSLEFLRKNKIAKIVSIIIIAIVIGGFAALLANLGGGDQQTTIILELYNCSLFSDLI